METTKKNKPIFASSNKYAVLANENDEIENSDKILIDIDSDTEAEQKVKPPPSIFISGILDFSAFRSRLIELIGADSFFVKSNVNNLKVQTNNADSYRATIHFLKESKAEYHTYQAQDEKPFRVVIRNIHPSTPLAEIGIAINEIGLFTVRNVSNVLNKTTKNKLPIFFIDLEPAEIKKEIFHITSLLNTKIKIEEPYKKRIIIQCTNCQEYGHSKSYCAHHPRCVKCAANHSTSTCTKSKDEPPACALCGAGDDFNAKHSQWGWISENQRGKMLQKITKNTPYIFISPKGPTYWPQHHNRHPDILDFFLSSLPRHIKHSVNNLNDLSSDHTPILLTTIASIEPTPHPSLSQGPIKWDKFSEIIQNTTYLNISLKNKKDIESAAQNLVMSIQSAIFKSSHPKTQSSKHNTSNQSLPTNITNLISEKRRVRSRWQKYYYPSDKKLYNHLANTIKKLILKHKSEYFENKYQSLNQTDGSLWKTTKNLLRIKEQLPPITDSDGSLAISDIEKANLFGKHLSKIFTPHTDKIPNSDHSETIEQFINSPLLISLPAKHTSPSEILFLIKKLIDGKSPGHDLITNKVLKNLPRKPILLISFIFNAMLRLSYFPLI
ncbi:hypothetical protein QTP88_005878 [Uroleucon formosanum]